MRLSIPTPCTQDWDAMTPADQGRHCAACQKVVVDFSRMTDGEIVALMQARAGQEICGRLETGQLGRELVPALPLPRKLPWWSWARVSAAAGALWLVLVGSSGSQQAQAQHKALHTQRATDIKSRGKQGKVSKPDNNNTREGASIMGDIVSDSLFLVAEDTVHTVVDVIPEPRYNFMKYINDELKASRNTLMEDAPNRFTVRFVVLKSGEVKNVEIVKGYNSEWDELLESVLSKMPPWKPGFIKDRPVHSVIILPIRIRWAN